MKYISTTVSTVLILIAVLLPGSQVPDVGFTGIDKLVHFIMFFVWVICFRRDLSGGFRWYVAFMVGILFSVLTEVLQIMVEDRTFDLYDMVADAVGLACGIAASPFILRWLNRFVRI